MHVLRPAATQVLSSPIEIRVELNLLESSISNIKYPDMFPSPPNMESALATEVLPSPVSSEIASPSVPEQTCQQPHQDRSYSESQKNSWYYYLSEIALRRIGNNVLNTFYTNDQYPGSGMPIRLMVKTVTNFVDQMFQWYLQLLYQLPFLRAHCVLGTKACQLLSSTTRKITVTSHRKN